MTTYAYFIENTKEDEYRDNSRLFKLINESTINDDNIFVDTDETKEELDALLETIEPGDTIVIRSYIDLADNKGDMLQLVKELNEFGIIVRSADEPGINSDDYCRSIYGAVKIFRDYQEKNRRKAFAEAKKSGIIGRPRMDKQTEKALRLYKTGEFSIDEITELLGVSSSTLYRALKEQRE
jgi:DNA invertase Pin-like site-specific DNA recombinase